MGGGGLGGSGGLGGGVAHKTCLKMRVRDKSRANENVRFCVMCDRHKGHIRDVASHLHLVRPRVIKRVSLA